MKFHIQLTGAISSNLNLYSPITSAGISLPYPTIFLHAIRCRFVTGCGTIFYVITLQVPLSIGLFGDYEEQTTPLSMVPTTENPARLGRDGPENHIWNLFAAIERVEIFQRGHPSRNILEWSWG